ncbi:hypothetical protein Tagg_0798 [Thermosphaera aggregans DSM 11486]|uniref:Uncharacterized protein n=2 Tax=Thermosphaera aggregans TaxID=54254 RepID=D5U1S1_THEAM|nr:hypothetical protein Tagg_0798 [Thermosphaera aggregans DSM 11486]
MLFTSKLVKTMLIRGDPSLASVFEPRAGDPPKPVHTTPLFSVDENGRLRCVYSYVRCGQSSTAKCSGRVEPVRLEGRYHFYLGFSTSVLELDRVLAALDKGAGCFEFAGKQVCVSLDAINVADPSATASKIAEKVLETGRVKITLASPAMLRDPFKRAKHKALIPTVMNLFSTPLYTMLVEKGLYGFKAFRRQIVMLHRVFNEPYTVLKTVNLKWVVYKKKPEPTLTGYVNLYVNKHYLERYSEQLDMKEYLAELTAHAITLGVGVGRATGFGHVFVEAGGPGPEAPAQKPGNQQ